MTKNSILFFTLNREKLPFLEHLMYRKYAQKRINNMIFIQNSFDFFIKIGEI
ncbi:hypothetical protein IWQ47_005295 [Aquimarina sp. EL_43]|nr:hypothetical protein [Aquimarina sp. EL_35]MBG6153960.1 hypothetical protein [Aquimarina sp. EL_32]MBG6172191.1 hypothetical protein [Aquimarina sp. EL_43]